MDYRPLPRQHIEAVENLFLSSEELQVEHSGWNFWVVLHALNPAQIIFHLAFCQLDQVMNACDFILKFLDHSFEGSWSILSIFG